MKPTFAIVAMEALSVDEIPEGPQWQYEPKWDGFRCILMREGDKVALSSRSGQDLKRYFPEIVAGALALKAKSFVLDGEIVVPVERQLSFEDLLQRIHPAASRIKKLAEITPVVPDFRPPEGRQGGSCGQAPLRAAPASDRFRSTSISKIGSFQALSRQPQAE